MKEFLDLLKNKKTLVGLIVLGVLGLGLFAGTNLIRQQQIIKSRATGQVCVPGSYDRHCTRQCGGCAANAGEMEVKQCKSDGTGYNPSFGECSTVCTGACSTNPSPLPPGSGSTGNLIDCKGTFTPSELGINNPRVCNRLHQYTSNNCERRCDTKNDCPQNTDQPRYIDPGTSNWCYEFKDNDNDRTNNNRCLQLRYIGSGTETSCAQGETGTGGICSATVTGKPQLSAACAVCINTNKPGLENSIRVLNTSLFAGCGNPQLLSFWCSDGLSPGAAAECNALKTGACASVCSAVGGPGGKYTVSGKVFGADGTTPVSGVNVEVWNDLNPAQSRSNTTNANGVFTVSDFIDNGKAYAVRIPKANTTITKVSTTNNTSSRQFAGQFAGQNTPLGNESYEFQLTTDTVCATACNFKIEAATTGTIGGKVVNASGTGVNGVKVWIKDEAGINSGACGGACDNGKYKSVTTNAEGRFSGQVTIGSHGYWVRIPRGIPTLGDDNNINDAIFTSASVAYERQPFNNTNKGCETQCNFTVQLVPSFPTKVRIANSQNGLPSSQQIYDFSGQYTPSNPLIIRDWLLDDGSGPKTVYIQFGFGTGADFQWDTQHTYSSEAVTYNPTPSPSPITCTGFVPDLTAEGQKTVGGILIPVYKTNDASGAQAKRLIVTSTPANVAVAEPTFTKDPDTASALEFVKQQNNPDWFVNIPANNTATPNEYTLSATVTGQTSQCPRFIIRVPAASVGGCVCSGANTCTSACPLTKLSNGSYADPIKCSPPSRIFVSSPSETQKNAWCNWPKRLWGDADGDGDVDDTDYLYYLGALRGEKIPPGFNPDFDGNGDIGLTDVDIWSLGKGK